MPTPERDLKIVRRAYGKQIMAASGVPYERLAHAFAAVPREQFLGPGPWPILRWGRGYQLSPSNDPVYLYTDDLIGIDPGREINNGQPSFHFALMARLDPQPGEHVVHIGAGTGYYSAILAELVGTRGRITAIEYEPALAALAADNLAARRQVLVLEGDGTALDFDAADGIYVNAGVTHPPARWLDRMRDGGRLILPMTAPPKAHARPAGAALDRRRLPVPPPRRPLRGTPGLGSCDLSLHGRARAGGGAGAGPRAQERRRRAREAPLPPPAAGR